MIVFIILITIVIKHGVKGYLKVIYAWSLVAPNK